jgi:NTP pyrophosphatase (non-canonical NTP hydrolase)
MNKEILYKALEKWGITMQIMMLVEEMAELTKEICKNFRGENNRLEMLDEICDVSIMLEQTKIVFNFSDKEIEEHINFKLSRINERLNK